MQINPGDFNTKAVIQSATITRNEYNEPIKAWGTFKTVWAQLKETGTKELYFAQKHYAESTALFIVRKVAGITAQMRVANDGRTFEIIGRPYSPDDDKNVLWIPVKEVV